MARESLEKDSHKTVKEKNLYMAWCNDTGYGYDEKDVEEGFYGGFGLAINKILEIIDKHDPKHDAGYITQGDRIRDDILILKDGVLE